MLEIRRVVPILILVSPVLALGPSALSVPGVLHIASSSDAGVWGNSRSRESALSVDGTKVAFESYATNLDPADTDLVKDVYVKNLATGDIILASTSDTGVKGNSDSSGAVLSADGTKVAFDSFASNLDPAAISGGNVYVKNLATGDITLASTSDAGVTGNSTSLGPVLSSDGTKVAFDSYATNLDAADTDGNADVYVKNLATGDIILASTSDTGVKGNSNSSGAVLSADGTKVAFHSTATNLDPANGPFIDVYVKNLATGDIVVASTSDAGVTGNPGSLNPSLSADGTNVAFESGATNLDPADALSGVDVYVKNLATGDIVLASTSDAGVKGNGISLYPSLSADGTKVAFESHSDNLDPADTDGFEDVYVKNLATGDITLASTSDAETTGGLAPALSADGTKVAFDTPAIAPGDTAGYFQVFVKELTKQVPQGLPRCLGQTATRLGTPGPDTMIGTSDPDVFVGLGGNDTLKGLGGNDRLCGGQGKDKLIGGPGRDRLSGGSGRDRLTGGPGSDRLNGGPGRDRCGGTAGVDRFVRCEVKLG